MNDHKNIAAGILASGKAMHEASGAKSVICSCDRLGMYRCEAHGESNRRKEGEAVIAAMSITELCVFHRELRSYVDQLEAQRDKAVAEREEGLAMLRECLVAIRWHPWGLDTDMVEKERDGLIRSLDAFLRSAAPRDGVGP